MAASVVVDTSFLISLLTRRDDNHRWSADQALRFPPPWKTCDAVLSETFHLLGRRAAPSLQALLQRTALVPTFHFSESVEAVLALMQKYADVPMSFADACLVRMTETLDDPVLLTIDADFRVYRRHGRQVVPCILPD